jgi:hypothetical protein
MKTMKRTIQLFSAVVLTILMVGLGGSVLIQRLKAHRNNDIERTSAQVKPCLEYRDLSAALEFTKEGEPISHHSYIASDGMRINSTYFYYRSPKKANRALRRKLTSAVQIVERGAKLNSKGQKTGSRVIGIFRSEVSRLNEFHLLWTDGSDLGIIRGPSLQHLLGFEKPTCP